MSQDPKKRRNIVDKRVDAYKRNRERVQQNKSNHIPFYGFDRFQKYVPGIVPGIMYKITSHMGMGKTQLAKYMFVIQPALYALTYKKDFKILYFAFEESKEEFLDSIMIHVVQRLYKVQLDRFKLMGMSDIPLTEAELEAIEKARVTVDQLMTIIEVIDDVYRPSDVFQRCTERAMEWGTFQTDTDGKIIHSQYRKKNPNQIVLVVSDHISLVERDYDAKTNSYLTQGQSMAQLSTVYGKRIITKSWKWAMMNVQQQALDSEKQQFTSRGDSIIEKILPSLDGMANNKEIARDDYVVIGLFGPARYAMTSYKGFNIENNTDDSFGDHFRTIHLLKNRFGYPNKILPVWFDGAYNYFKELPLPNDPDFQTKLKPFINKLIKKRNES